MGKVLVTGANGFVAAHVVLDFLKKGHSVVGTVRSTKRQLEASSTVPDDLKSGLSWAIVPDAGANDAWDQVIKENPDLDGIIHTATPFHYNFNDPHELYDPAVQGTISILEAAKKYGPNVKRIVITSSCASVIDPYKGSDPGFVYSEAIWNPITKEKALAGDKGDAYFGAKTWAEKSAWEFMENNKDVKFTLATICPPFIFGPIVNYVPTINDLGTSNAHLYSFISGALAGGEIPRNMVWAWVDIRNLSESHLLAYEKPEAANERIIVATGTYVNKQIVDIFAKNFPERASNLPTKLLPNTLPNGDPEEGLFVVNNEKSKRVLGIDYIPMEKMILDFMASVKYLEVEVTNKSLA